MLLNHPIEYLIMQTQQRRARRQRLNTSSLDCLAVAALALLVNVALIGGIRSLTVPLGI